MFGEPNWAELKTLEDKRMQKDKSGRMQKSVVLSVRVDVIDLVKILVNAKREGVELGRTNRSGVISRLVKMLAMQIEGAPTLEQAWRILDEEFTDGSRGPKTNEVERKAGEVLKRVMEKGFDWDNGGEPDEGVQRAIQEGLMRWKEEHEEERIEGINVGGGKSGDAQARFAQREERKKEELDKAFRIMLERGQASGEEEK